MIKQDTKLVTNKIPDLNRWYLANKVVQNTDPTEKQVLSGLLEGYDEGRITMKFDPWKGEMMYSVADIN